jgi:hypothetical protein
MSVGIRRTLYGLPSLLVFSTSLREYRACHHSQRTIRAALAFYFSIECAPLTQANPRTRATCPTDLAGFIAGANRMPFANFMIANSASAVAWALFYGLGAYHLGKGVEEFARPFLGDFNSSVRCRSRSEAAADIRTDRQPRSRWCRPVSPPTAGRAAQRPRQPVLVQLA